MEGIPIGSKVIVPSGEEGEVIRYSNHPTHKFVVALPINIKHFESETTEIPYTKEELKIK